MKPLGVKGLVCTPICRDICTERNRDRERERERAARARAGERESESERARELERESGRGGTGREREREIGAGKGRERLPIQHSCPHLDSRAGSMRPSKPSWFDKTVCPDLPNTVLFQFDILRKDVEPSLKPQEDWVKRSKAP